MFESEKLQFRTPVKLQSKGLDYWFDAADDTIFIFYDKSGNNQYFLQKIFAFFRKTVTNLIAIFKSL